MAFKLSNLKNLFRKLIPYADDVAKGVANYGDDAAKLVANKGDDALRAVDKVDDALPFVGTRPSVRNSYDVKRFWDNGDVVSINGRAFQDPSDALIPYHQTYGDYLDRLEDYGVAPISFESYVGRKGVENLTKENILQNYIEGSRTYDALAGFDLTVPTAQQRLKDDLLYKRSPASLDVRDIPKLPAVVPNGHVWERWGKEDVAKRLHVYDSPYWGGFPKTTEYLGDVVGDLGEGLVPDFPQTSVKIPELPTSQLVAQTPKYGVWDDLHVVGLRPHKNTALGRWFAKNLPNYPQHQLIDDYDIF